MINTGTIVYLCWYDFQKQTEHICKGEVVDNELWAGTKQADMINVSFQPPGMSGPIQHHFTADKLSEDAASVPHDDCYLVCGKKTRFFEHDIAGKLKKNEKLNASDAWQQVQQFKTDHWDYEHGHLQQEYLNEFYQLWHDAIAAKLGTSVTFSHIRQNPILRRLYRKTVHPQSLCSYIQRPPLPLHLHQPRSLPPGRNDPAAPSNIKTLYKHHYLNKQL